ncbi:uncharacterized protein CDAR_449661 [Caerostris darwini]|uniref:Uncharacterized protein n=1 Tax=Caerostris darwini TaxID=1538125 RepID=A0AAV4QQS9_9ARAC|nr:uncharacterized protein CDAR_449661 [Caerostris darwini]
MGLGKKSSGYDPALKYMGLGKKSSGYDPALKYMGLGKKSSGYDPALKYMGLGKKSSGYDPALKYMGLGKKSTGYDPALKYMGLGKKSYGYDPALKYMGLGKKSSDYDPALNYMGLGKKSSNYDPALRYMGLGKKRSLYDPALKYMGLGKRSDNQNSKKIAYDPALIYMGLGKRRHWNTNFENFSFDPSLYRMLPTYEKYEGNIFNPSLKTFSVFDSEEIENDTKARKQGKFEPDIKYAELKDNENENNLRPVKINPIFNWMDQGEKSEDTIRNYGSSMKVYPDPQIIRKLVNYFNSLTPKYAKKLPSASGEEISDHQNDESDVNSNSIEHLNKKPISYDPTYNVLGKKNASGRSELKDLLGKSQDCKISCKYAIRRKRDIRNNVDEILRMNSRDYSLKKDYLNGFVDEPELDNLMISGLMTPSEVKIKREWDNRPKYNPGWIFIGLGKRYPESDNVNFQIADPDSLLTKYYNLMEKVKDSLQNIKYDLMNENKDKLISFHNSITTQSDFPETYRKDYPISNPDINNPVGLLVSGNLHAGWPSTDPYLELNLIRSMVNQPGKGQK